jgi:hypothetical protein
MTLVEQKTLAKALTLLEALKVKYCVIDSDQTSHGNLKVAEAPKKLKKRQPSPYRRGERSEYITKHLKGMEVGDVKVVPFGDYLPEMLQSNVSSWCCNRFGVGGAKVTANKEAKRIEVLRTK